MRVVLISTSSRYGGGPRVVKDLAVGLKKQGIAVTVISPPSGWLVEELYTNGVEHVGFETDKISLNTLFKLISYLKKGNYNVVHSHGKGAGFYSRICKLALGSKVIHTHHGIHFAAYSNLVKFTYCLYERLLGLITDRIVNVSVGQQKQGIRDKLFTPNKCIVINNGIDVNSYIFDSKKAREQLVMQYPVIQMESVLIINIARFDPVKNHLHMIDQFHAVASVGNGFYLMLVGDGEQFELVKNKVNKIGLSDKIIFVGYVDKPYMHLAGADIYWSASLGEGFPITLLEAGASSKPAIVSNVVGNSEIIDDGENGYLYNLNDSNEFIDKMENLIKNTMLRTRMGSIAKTKVENIYSVDNMVNKHIQLYRQVIEKLNK